VTQLESRDGTEAKDGLMSNCFAEKSGSKTYAKKRFGTSVYASLPAGTGLGMFTLLGIDYAIINVSGNDTLYTFSGTSYALPSQPSVNGLPYQVIISNDGNFAFLKT